MHYDFSGIMIKSNINYQTKRKNKTTSDYTTTWSNIS